MTVAANLNINISYLLTTWCLTQQVFFPLSAINESCFPFHFISLRFTLSTLQNQSVAIMFIQRPIDENDKVQTDDKDLPPFSVCLMDICMIKLSLKTERFGF